jgi:hypothetical protein
MAHFSAFASDVKSLVMVYANNCNATYSSDGADKVSLHKNVNGYYAGNSLAFKHQDIVYNVAYSNNKAPINSSKKRQTLIDLAKSDDY